VTGEAALDTKVLCLPKTVTHPTINRAQCRVTSLIETNALPLSHGFICTSPRYSKTLQIFVTIVRQVLFSLLVGLLPSSGS